MGSYIAVLKNSFTSTLAFPSNIITNILSYILRVSFLLVFWNFVGSSIDTQTNLLSYFLITSGISELLMVNNTNIGKSIRKSIHRGEINQILIKPVNIPLFYAFSTIGKLSFRILISSISVVIGLILFNNLTLEGLILFLIFFLLAIPLSFAYNLIEGTLSLLIIEVSGIKNSIHHIVRLLSGQWIPLTFFPILAQNILILTPIPYLLYMPFYGLNSTFNTDSLIMILIGLIYAIGLNLIIYKWWLSSLKKYDSAGS